ncbi:RNA polymerase sigma-70 factor (ECF subfamily) [Rhizobium azooxidifex]|uniref:RNA polymerase sigma-70 factor (ECF subfamily) n=1 Tax=Mycoplana azooxidifex TaxID=1636188 RepID=A0A7W6DHS4_9HYPH|nr:sigma-70 family RNA polymerase sigma factor [Mycoplana azooxidifex]MBB3980068.1 RNA polymerase sigma-70 factor (ECF subfamily) [Mycoplana azooxidifex]
MTPVEAETVRAQIVALIPVLKRFALKLRYQEPDDLVQETLTKALARLEGFSPGSNLKGWLFTIMRNAFCTGCLRAKRESPGRDFDFEEIAIVAMPTQEWHLQGCELERALRELPRERQVLFDLIFVQGESYKRAAFEMHCAIGTIKSRVNRMRKQLSSELN